MRTKTSHLPTPIDHHRLEWYLQQANYDADKTKYLINGFREGFLLFHSSQPQDIHSNNSTTINHHLDAVQLKLHKELQLGRIAGPFSSPPFSPFQISPLSVREKKEPGKVRLLHNLSYPYDDRSVNSQIPQSHKTVKYATVGHAIDIIAQFRSPPYLAKTDIAEAFRNIPIHPNEHPKLGFFFQGAYYYDRCLPMGSGSSCAIFESFSSALQAIFQHQVPDAQCLHMLDDFLFIAQDNETCQRHLDAFITICRDIGVPIAQDKTTTPSTSITFLGIQLDTVHKCARLPPDKLQAYKQELLQTLSGSKIRRKNLESLTGKLAFASTVVPARPFLRRLIEAIHTVKKPYYFIRLSQPLREDLNTWLRFLQTYNGITFFRFQGNIPSTQINMASDASKQAFGACYGAKWIQCQYPTSWQKYHITVLEIYPVYMCSLLCWAISYATLTSCSIQTTLLSPLS